MWISGRILVGYSVLVVGLILCNVVIWKLAPCVHENHSLEEEKITKAKTKAVKYSVVISIIAIGLEIVESQLPLS